MSFPPPRGALSRRESLRAGFVLIGATSVLAPLRAFAAPPPVMLVDGRSAQNRMAADAVTKELSLQELEENAAGTPDKLRAAPLVIAVGPSAFERAKAAGAKAIVVTMVAGLDSGALPRNIAGVRLEVDPYETLSAVQQAVPRATVHLVVHPSLNDFRARAKQMASVRGVTLVEHLIPDAFKAKELVLTPPGNPGDVLWFSPDARVISPDLFATVLSAASKQKVAVIGFLPAMARAGALMAHSANYERIGHLAGRMAAEWLPALEKVPKLEFAPGDLTLNGREAKELGMKLPAELLARASYVFR